MAGQENGGVTPENVIPQEFERKFLLDSLPPGIPQEGISIRQGYISIDTQTEVRVRAENNTDFSLTVKNGEGAVRGEVNIPISREHFDSLWSMSEGRRIEKTRYKLPLDGYTIEIDSYHGELEGLTVAEVECEDEDSLNSFAPPSWMGREVTEDASFKNKNLATKGVNIIEGIRKPEMNQVEGVDMFLNRIGELTMQKDGSVIVMVSGRTSSGKTTAVTSKILEQYGDDAIVISTDDYSKGNRFIEHKRRQGVEMNWDHPDYIDTPLLREHIEQIKRGESIKVPEYSFITGEREGTKRVDPAKVVIIEGLYALHSDIQDLGDVRAFVDISLHGSIIRRLLRDVSRTTMGPTEILDYYLSTVEPMYQQYVAPTQEHADFVLENEYSPDIESGKSGRNELQIKFDVGLTEQDMTRVGAHFVGSVEQVDRYFHPFERNLDESDEITRIRREGGKYFLTYKGPRVDGEARKRPILTFEIPEELERVFSKSYGSEVKTIQKHRDLYLLRDAIVALDRVVIEEDGRVRDLGSFAEIQIPEGEDGSRKKLEVISVMLGLDYELRDPRPYVSM